MNLEPELATHHHKLARLIFVLPDHSRPYLPPFCLLRKLDRERKESGATMSLRLKVDTTCIASATMMIHMFGPFAPGWISQERPQVADLLITSICLSRQCQGFTLDVYLMSVVHPSFILTFTIFKLH